MSNVISQEFKHAIDEKRAEVLYIEEGIQHVMSNLHQLEANVATILHIPETRQDVTELETDSRSSATSEAADTIDRHSEFFPDLTQKTSLCCEEYPMSVDKMQEDVVLSTALHAPLHSGDMLQNSIKCQEHHVVQRTLVIGNTSKYLLNKIDSDHSDNATHKWMVYVTERPGEDDISEYVKSVWFLLDPSYKPNDQVHVTSPPFQLVRRGWGEFLIRIRVHFHNPLNRAVDILHHLVLDFTKSGRQMFGSEREVAIEIFEDIHSAKSVEYVHARNVNPSSILEPALCTKAGILCTSYVSHDHSYCSSFASICSDAPRVSPSGSCRDAYLASHVNSYSATLVKLLQKLVEQVPIVSRNDSGFNATSEHEFHSWGVAKQHAYEWMRAVSLKALLRPVLKTSTEVVPSTKGLVLWCRQNGHTPLMPVVSGTEFCKLCGFVKCVCVSSHNVLELSSLTPIIPFYWDHVLLSLDADVSCTWPVDVQDGNFILDASETSDDTAWIMMVIAELGSDIESKWCSSESSHLCHHVIATACKLWLNTILHEANKNITGYPVCDGQRTVLPFQIYKAITGMSCCQFLNNSGLLLEKY